jgi:hypothetical protein
MFVYVATPQQPTRFISRARIQRDIAPGVLGTFMRPGTHRGIAGMRPAGRALSAAETAYTYRRLQQFVSMTGWVLRVETTSREARDLMARGIVTTSGQLYWISQHGVVAGAR